MSTDSRSDIFAAFHQVAVVASSSSSYRPRSANISIQNGVQGPLGSLYFVIVRVSSVVLPYRSIIHRLFSKSAKERARREEKRFVKGERSLESFFFRGNKPREHVRIPTDADVSLFVAGRRTDHKDAKRHSRTNFTESRS